MVNSNPDDNLENADNDDDDDDDDQTVIFQFQLCIGVMTSMIQTISRLGQKYQTCFSKHQ